MSSEGLRPLIAYFDLTQGPLSLQQAMNALGVQNPRKLRYAQLEGRDTLIHDPKTMSHSARRRYRRASGEDAWKVLQALVEVSVPIGPMVEAMSHEAKRGAEMLAALAADDPRVLKYMQVDGGGMLVRDPSAFTDEELHEYLDIFGPDHLEAVKASITKHFGD